MVKAIAFCPKGKSLLASVLLAACFPPLPPEMIAACEGGAAEVCLELARRYKHEVRNTSEARDRYVQACSLGSEEACETSDQLGVWTSLPDAVPSELTCADRADELLPTHEGKPLHCPTDCDGTLWGTGLYSVDSSICSAARHAGLEGGAVAIFAAGSRNSFSSSRQNGVASDPWSGRWKAFHVRPVKQDRRR
ncbi:MAG: LCCL domain-containing protein [Myxococcota bacterium]